MVVLAALTRGVSQHPAWNIVCALTIKPLISLIGKGGKNRRRGKGDGEESKRELEFKEDGRCLLRFRGTANG